MPERSPEEREAARLERERRRAERAGSVDYEPEPKRGPEPGRERESAPELEPNGGAQEIEDEWDEPEPEYDGEGALGVKRVSRLQRMPSDRRKPPRRREPRRAPRPRRRVTSRGGRFLALVALILTGAVLWFLYSLFQPFHASGHGRVTVTIPARASASEIGDVLANKGVISSSFFFGLRATLDGERSHLRSGTYHLKLDMSYSDVLKVLTTAPPAVPTTTLTLIEGKSRQQIDALLRSQHIHGSYIAATRHSRLLDPTKYGAPHSTPDLEGFLFPSTYQLRKPVDIGALVADQLTTFKQRFARVNLSYARSKHLTPYAVLTIASIIEDEAAAVHDYPLVAAVIYNRLKDHIPLGMDSTTRYEFNDWNHPLTNSQLAAHSPYNTRLNPGLPPTPIGNPGIAAIDAAAHPARTNYLYFVAGVCQNGRSVFSSSYQQFLRDSAKYQNARAQRGGRSPVNC
jgi:peptidoglycan lytic transglycosylase G